jgi:hypothetical protein
MRLTCNLYFEINAERLDPAFFGMIAQYETGKGIDGGGWVRRELLGTVEIEQDGTEGHIRLQATRYGEYLASRWAMDRGISIDDWRTIGRVTVEVVPNSPQSYPQGVCESPNPAIRCKDCGGPMIKRKSGTGPFWACPQYPQCRGSRPHSK